MNTNATNPNVMRAGGLISAIRSSFVKLDPRIQIRNPVMFAVYLGSLLTTLLWFKSLSGDTEESPAFIFGVAIWLWFTVLFANFAEAIAEGHGKAKAAELKKSRTNVIAKRLTNRQERIAEECERVYLIV